VVSGEALMTYEPYEVLEYSEHMSARSDAPISDSAVYRLPLKLHLLGASGTDYLDTSGLLE
jgi:hypothetical protein